MKKLFASLIILAMLGGIFVPGFAHASAAAAYSAIQGGDPGGNPEPPLMTS